MLCHATEKSSLTLACATESTLQTPCLHTFKVVHSEDCGQVAFTVQARPGVPIELTKYIVYHTSNSASAQELSGRAERTLDRITPQGFQEMTATCLSVKEIRRRDLIDTCLSISFHNGRKL